MVSLDQPRRGCRGATPGCSGEPHDHCPALEGKRAPALTMGPTTEAVDTGVPSAAVADAIDKRAGRSPSQIAWDRLKSDKVAIGSLVIVVFFVLVAIFAPLLVALEGEELNKYHPELISAANTYPIIGATPQHWFGVEPRTGRDLFAVWAWGARPSLIIGFTAATFSTLLGIAIGLTAGYLGGVVDKIITWIIDVLLSLPFLLMVLALVPVIQSRFTKPGEVLTAEETSGIRFWVLIAILVFFGWIGLARLIRGEVPAAARARVRPGGEGDRRSDATDSLPRDPAQSRWADHRLRVDRRAGLHLVRGGAVLPRCWFG